VLVWALFRALEARWLAGIVGFWALGIATHLFGDLGDDALRGIIHGGQWFYAFFLWPFATPYVVELSNPYPFGFWPSEMTPLELGVLVAACVWLSLRVRRFWMRRAHPDVPVEPSGPTPSSAQHSLTATRDTAERSAGETP
jgi:hypothetical protein